MKLPEDFKNKNYIENMEEYSSSYVVPRSMRVNRKGECYVYERAEGHESPGGTGQLKITKVPEGYIVHIHEMEKDCTWEQMDEYPGVGSDFEKSYGAVVAFSMEEYCKEYHVSSKNFPVSIEKKISEDVKNIRREITRVLKKKVTKN